METGPVDSVEPLQGRVEGLGRRSVIERFVDAARQRPGRVAVVAETGELTFGELDQRSAVIAAELTGRGVGREALVGLCLPRGVDLVAAILGVLRAGAAYVPMDPSYPEDRLAFLIADSGVRIMLADRSTVESVPETDLEKVLLVDGLADVESSMPEQFPGPDDLAYLMYTSGSTGRPKGVQITHGSVSALLDGLSATGVFRASRGRVAWNANVSFDASVQQWIRVCRGDCLIVVPEHTRVLPTELARFLVAQRATDLDITPSHLEPLLEELTRWPGDTLRLLVGGEEVSPRLWQQLARLEADGAVSAVNLYGPTECTVDATVAWISASAEPTIGTPLPGVRLYLLDDQLVPVPDGDPGEVYLAGSCLARGYHRRPRLTAERFMTDVVAADGSLMYRTGDRAYRGPDGQLRFLGRVDDQVKLRGHRIELGEVAEALSTLPEVERTVVLLRDDLPIGKGLVAYCLTTRPVPTGRLRTAAARMLPNHMVPSDFVVLDQFPISTTGKIDRSRLPLPDPRGGAARPGRRIARLIGPTEVLVARLWTQVLDIDEIGATDDFFELGGRAEMVDEIVEALRRGTRSPITAETLLATPRLRDLAAAVDRAAGAVAPGRMEDHDR